MYKSTMGAPSDSEDSEDREEGAACHTKTFSFITPAMHGRQRWQQQTMSLVFCQRERTFKTVTRLDVS